MAKTKNLESIVNSANSKTGLEGKLKGYKESVAIGQLGGLAATAATIYGGLNYPQLISNYIPGVAPLLGSTLGLGALAAASNFIGDQIGFATSLYAYNKEKYKGLNGKLRFIKDGFNLGIRHFGSYFITYPLAIAASTAAVATGLLTGPLAFILPYAAESAITGLGYIASTLGYRKKQAQAPAPAYAT